MKLGLQLHTPLSSQPKPVEPSALQLQALKMKQQRLVIISETLKYCIYYVGMLES